MKKPTDWIPISKRLPKDYRKVDIWMCIQPSLRSMGWGDSFRQTEVWREDGKWVHHSEGKKLELYAPYVTHWMPQPRPPKTA